MIKFDTKKDKEIKNLKNIIYEIEMFINKYSGIDGKIKSTPLLNYIQELKEGK